jgi:hypothetical protein
MSALKLSVRRRVLVPVWLLPILLAFVIGAAISFASGDEPVMVDVRSAPAPPPPRSLPFSCLQPVVGHC